MSEMKLDEYLKARDMLAKILYPQCPDASEKERAERLLDAGVVDLIELAAYRGGRA